MKQMNASRTNALRILMHELAGEFGRLKEQFQNRNFNPGELAESPEAAVIVTDTRGRIAHVSPGFTALTGFAATDIAGQTPAMALHGQQTDHHTVETLRASCRAAESFSVNILLYDHSNQPIWVNSQGRPIVRGGKFHGYAITHSPIAPDKTADHFSDHPRANAA